LRLPSFAGQKFCFFIFNCLILDSKLSSTVKISVSQTITDRSMTFCSSRMFSGPGVRLEQLQGPFVYTPDALARFARISIDEVFNK